MIRVKMDREYFGAWREELPRTRVDDKTIKAIIAAKTRNPKTPNRTLAKRYKVSETTISNYTVHLKRGEHKTLDELRLYIATRYLEEKCEACNKFIKRANDGLCRRCYSERTRIRNGSIIKNPIAVKYCNKSPSQYHYWVIDVYSIGKCKYCKKEQQYYPWEDSQVAAIQLDL